MNPDKIFGIDKFSGEVQPSRIGDVDLYTKIVVYELPNSSECFIDLYYHLNFQIVKRLVTTSRTAKFKTRVFSSTTFAISFLRKRGFNKIELRLNGSGLDMSEGV